VTARTAGAYTVSFKAPSDIITPPSDCTFTVAAAASGVVPDCGFVRVDQTVSTQHFVTDGMNSFFGVGMNLAWVSGAKSIEENWVP
jgi:hypothetical protein